MQISKKLSYTITSLAGSVTLTEEEYEQLQVIVLADKKNTDDECVKDFDTVFEEDGDDESLFSKAVSIAEELPITIARSNDFTYTVMCCRNGDALYKCDSARNLLTYIKGCSRGNGMGTEECSVYMKGCVDGNKMGPF